MSGRLLPVLGEVLRRRGLDRDLDLPGVVLVMLALAAPEAAAGDDARAEVRDGVAHVEPDVRAKVHNHQQVLLLVA